MCVVLGFIDSIETYEIMNNHEMVSIANAYRIECTYIFVEFSIHFDARGPLLIIHF